MVKIFSIFFVFLALAGCGAGQTTQSASQQGQFVAVEPGASSSPQSAQAAETKPALKITVGEQEWLATFEDNPSAQELETLLEQGELTILMEDYGGFEKVGPLGQTLTRSDSQITAVCGDVILYQGNQITIYYGTNSWNFTRLAKIDQPEDLAQKLGEGSVEVTFSLEPEV